MRVQITGVSITGFKGNKETKEFKLGYRSLITGDNGLGKSTIGESIVWALTGCDIWGNEKAATKLVNDKKPKVTEVILDFLLDDEPQTIIRRKKGNSNEVYWNDAKSSTNDIARDIFKNKDVFLSIVNPYYFPNLAPKDAKQLLSDVLKPVSREEIFKDLGDYLKKILLDNGFRLPETFLSDVRSDLKDHEENLIFLEGKASNLNQVEVKEKKIFDDTQLKSLEKELEKLTRGSSSLETQLSKLKKPNDNTAELSELKIKEAELRATKIDLQPLLPIEAKKAKKADLLKDFREKEKKLNTMESKIIQCDNCNNEIDLTKEAKEMLKQELEEIKEKGTKLKLEIEEIEAKNAEIIKSNDQMRAAGENEINSKLAEIEKARQQILADGEKAQKEYEEKRKSIISKNAAAEEKSKEKISYIKSQISDLKNQEKEIINYNAQIDAAIKQNEKSIEDQKLNDINITNSKNKIEQLKLAIDAAQQYNSIKLKKQAEQIKPYLKKVEIQFEKITKEGELKDDFKIVYDGKEFNKLSTSERIKAGLEISNLLMNTQNLHFPIFVDDTESINIIPELDTQMIKAKVTTDKDVKVEVIKQ